MAHPIVYENHLKARQLYANLSRNEGTRSQTRVSHPNHAPAVLILHTDYGDSTFFLWMETEEKLLEDKQEQANIGKPSRLGLSAL